ncbi:MAG: single-stranded-DNA-specific exonuclease RecJ [Phycisphaerales bacterium]|nr:single-stranded-DNA-specific exonuclease RecJ [Phycisphaerales bacterium]
MIREWIIRPAWVERDAAAERWRVHPLIAQLLFNRGVHGSARPSTFLDPQLGELYPPELLPGATVAAAAIAAAVRDRRKIVIYGDYDVDGMTGLAILWHVLRAAGADVSFYVPHRLDEGYGVNVEAVRGLVADGAQLIVTVDCGVTAVEAAAAVRSAGAEIIITDHHQSGDTLPEGVTIVHPTVGGQYPNEHLCGAGVAFKLGWAIAQAICGSQRVNEPYRSLLSDALALAALGTVADVVPLIGENRVIVRHGLARLTSTPFVGLRVLMESAGLANGKVHSYDVGFKLAPRLNAAGRMGHARLAVELLTRADEARSREIALYLEEQNRARQTTERRIARQATELVEAKRQNGDACRAVVLAQKGWHAGVIGIVASRLVDKFHRPTVLISLGDEIGQGSARSVPNFNLVEALAACGEHLIEFGGHAMAAGLKIKPDRVTAFTEAFTHRANNHLTGADLKRKLWIDAEVALHWLDLPTADALSKLGPFGQGNPRPVLCTDWVTLADEPRTVGASGGHVQAVFSDGKSAMKSIAFGQASALEPLKHHRRCRVAFEPIVNEFNGRRTVEMQVIDFQFPS